MYWLLPRSHPGALTTHESAGVRFSTPRGHGLPHGAAARLLMVWMHLEAERTGCAELPLGRSLEAFARALDIDAEELAEQIRRLGACTLFHEGWTCPIATPAPGPALRLGAPLYETLRAHRLEVSLPCLRALSRVPALLDHYLRKCYTREYYRVDLTMPSARAMLRDSSHILEWYVAFSALWTTSARRPCSAWEHLYQELAERPSPEPTACELLEFRDRASAEQLTVFTVEAAHDFRASRARRRSLLSAL